MSYPESDPIPGEVYVWATAKYDSGGDPYLILSFDSKSGDLLWYNTIILVDGKRVLISFLSRRRHVRSGNWRLL
jgi:hypothetical protein